MNPATEEEICMVPDSTAEDVDAAVVAARHAFDLGEWKNMYALDRGKFLLKLAALIRRDRDELIKWEVMNNGKPLREAGFDIDDAANCFEYYAGLASKIQGDTMPVPPGNFSYTVKEPIGVCGQIVPWNYPLLMAVWKLAPALAAGNCVVLKTSEITPISALYLAQLIQEVDFPPGVVNIISGDGSIAGAALVAHPLVDKIAFTGGTVTGKKIMQAAADTLKKVTLELGGKNPAIVFADCNWERTIDWCLFAAFANSGQVCSAGSRIYVQDSVYDRFVAEFVTRSQQIKVGNGLNPDSHMGPLVSASHYEKVKKYIEIGKQEGAYIASGGGRPTHLARGYFLEPTVFINVREDMRIMTEEIFGPVVCLQKFSTEDEVIALANQTSYGLAAGIFTENITRAQRLLPQLKCGITWINYFHPTFNEQPWGGFKQSGTGRELGIEGINAYIQTKQVNINLDQNPAGWYI
jgi:betaine-aldehyde dehydrogenase